VLLVVLKQHSHLWRNALVYNTWEMVLSLFSQIWWKQRQDKYIAVLMIRHLWRNALVYNTWEMVLFGEWLDQILIQSFNQAWRMVRSDTYRQFSLKIWIEKGQVQPFFRLDEWWDQIPMGSFHRRFELKQDWSHHSSSLMNGGIRYLWAVFIEDLNWNRTDLTVHQLCEWLDQILIQSINQAWRMVRDQIPIDRFHWRFELKQDSSHHSSSLMSGEIRYLWAVFIEDFNWKRTGPTILQAWWVVRSDTYRQFSLKIWIEKGQVQPFTNLVNGCTRYLFNHSIKPEEWWDQTPIDSFHWRFELNKYLVQPFTGGWVLRPDKICYIQLKKTQHFWGPRARK
jgi:hypothetical protein